MKCAKYFKSALGILSELIDIPRAIRQDCLPLAAGVNCLTRISS